MNSELYENLKNKDDISSIKEIKVIGVDDTGKVVSKFMVKTENNNPTAKSFLEVTTKVFDIMLSKKKEK